MISEAENPATKWVSCMAINWTQSMHVTHVACSNLGHRSMTSWLTLLNLVFSVSLGEKKRRERVRERERQRSRDRERERNLYRGQISREA